MRSSNTHTPTEVARNADLSLEADATSDLHDCDIVASACDDFAFDSTQLNVCESDCADVSVLPTSMTMPDSHDTGYQTQSASQSSLAAGGTSSTNLTNQFSNLQTSLGALSPSSSARRLALDAGDCSSLHEMSTGSVSHLNPTVPL